MADGEPLHWIWPPELDSATGPLLRSASGLMATEQWGLALEALSHAYRTLLAGQPPGIRFHKGFPLHNMGLCSLWLGNAEMARTHFLLAFIEDVLTNPTVEWNANPAARTLTGLFLIAEAELAAVAATIRTLRERGEDVRDPERLFTVLNLTNRFHGEIAVNLAPRRKQPGRFQSDWQRRVFVGGSYRGQVAELNFIAQVCRAGGYDPVVEFEFEIPPKLIHHHALMLLHECRLAIFEVSTEAGQLMELERVRDYGIEPLVLFQGMPNYGRVSAMVETSLGRLGLMAMRYGTMEELAAHVHRYLATHAQD